VVVEFAYRPAPVSTTDSVSKLPAVGYNPPDPGGSWTLFVVDVPFFKGATGAENVVVADGVELAARNTDGDIVSSGSGAVPKDDEGGGEDNARYEDDGRSAGANIELLDVEGALSDAGGSCGCVELTATVEFVSETTHVPCQSTLYSFSRTTMFIAAREIPYFVSCDGFSAILNDRWPGRQTQ